MPGNDFAENLVFDQYLYCVSCRYAMCSRIMEERFHTIPNTNLGTVVLLVSTAPDSGDISSLLRLLLYNVAPETGNKIIETFYLLLTYFQLFRDEFDMPWRPGYLLFHALSLHHNSWTVQAGGDHQEMQLTAEQRRIVNMDLGSLVSTDVVRIMALAGTGKTTTLTELTRRHPDTKFLLVVFNKSVSLHSRKVFPENVIVKTANSLSYQFIINSQGPDRFQGWNIKYSDLIYYIPKKEYKFYSPFNLYHWAAMIIDTISRFCNGADASLAKDHTPTEWTVHPDTRTLEDRHREYLLEDSKKIWKKIRDPRFSVLKFDHTTSMKEFQLSKPNLKDYVNHDVLLLDEAQDMNPCMLRVCLDQEVPKILVGDTFQQIYGFRGAVNAMENIKSETCKVRETFYLSKSFRFGAEIAFAAECCLKLLLGASGPSIVGTSKRDSVTGHSHRLDTRPEDKVAIIGRTNLGLFSEMVNLVCMVEEHRRPKIAFPTGGRGKDPMGWDKLEDMSHLKNKNHRLIKNLKNPVYEESWEHFVNQVRASNDKEMISKIKIVEKYGAKIPEFLKICREQSLDIDDRRVTYVFSTVHKFKGLEMENVRLLDDFYYDGIPYSNPRHQDQERKEREEFNLLYVALTRAKSLLMMNEALYFLLTSSAVGSCYELLREPPQRPSNCVLCHERTDQYQTPAVLWQQPLTILDTIKRSSGYLCSVCAWADRRKVYHQIGGKFGDLQRWRVQPGTVKAGYHSWLQRIVSPAEFSPAMETRHRSDVLDQLIPRDLMGCPRAANPSVSPNNVVDLLFPNEVGYVNLI